MKSNISTTDRIIRLLLAALVAVLYFTHQIEGTVAILLNIAGVIVAATAVFNFCPIYHLLGISTLKNQNKHETPN
jgi:DUF2892 family protein